MSQFKKQVYKVVSMIPYGTVASYGQVALYVGVPRGARQVGWMLNALEDHTHLPWWRVVNNQGRISIKGSTHDALEQKERLLAEGVEVSDELDFDIKKYRFLPDHEFIKNLKLPEEYLDMVMDKFPFSDNFVSKK